MWVLDDKINTILGYNLYDFCDGGQIERTITILLANLQIMRMTTDNYFPSAIFQSSSLNK